MPPLAAAVVAVLSSYLLGSIPVGLVLSKLIAGIDPRQVGSGNVGATNVARTIGRWWFPIVFLLDAAKGWLPPLFIAPLAPVGEDWAPVVAVVCAGAAVLGHVASVFLGFRGGKGVATTAGAAAALAPGPALVALATFALTLLVSRFISLASVLAAIVLPIAAWNTGAKPGIVLLAALAGIVIVGRHWSNLVRIWKGEEPKLTDGGRAKETNVVDESAQETPEHRRVAVIGNGGWGTALALVAARNGADTRLWGYEAEYVAETARTRENSRYLAGVELPEALLLTSDAKEALQNVDLVLSVVPTQFIRATFTSIGSAVPAGVPIVSCSKGVERDTVRRPSEILREVLGPRPIAVLSGPNHAEELARGAPATTVVACEEASVRESVQHFLSDPGFRIYGSDDVIGVELAAAVKNVIALAAGMIDGLDLGDNAKAALITRGAAEMARLGRELGAEEATFAGLAGIGDLIATCVSPHGRNRGVGERLGRGETLQDVLGSMMKVAEGVHTARGIVQLARSHDVEMPICEAVSRILYEELAPRDALNELMTRELRFERD